MTASLLAPASPAPLTSAVSLQPLRPIHALELSALLLDVDGLSPGSHLTRYVRTRRWVMRQLAHRSADHRSYVVTNAGQVVGVLILQNVRRGRTFAAELSLHLDEGGPDKDVARAAVGRAGYLAAELGLHRLEAAALPGDDGLRWLLAVSGFVPVGLARGYRMVAGQWRDHVLYERLVGEAVSG